MYMEGSSSAVVDVDDPDFERFPRFQEALKQAVTVILKPGDMLYIPGMSSAPDLIRVIIL